MDGLNTTYSGMAAKQEAISGFEVTYQMSTEKLLNELESLLGTNIMNKKKWPIDSVEYYVNVLESERTLILLEDLLIERLKFNGVSTDKTVVLEENLELVRGRLSKVVDKNFNYYARQATSQTKLKSINFFVNEDFLVFPSIYDSESNLDKSYTGGARLEFHNGPTSKCERFR